MSQAGAISGGGGSGGSGSLVLIDSEIASNSASLSFTSGIDSTYATYMLNFDGLNPVNNGVQALLQVSTDGGANYEASNYFSGGFYTEYNNSTPNNTQSGNDFLSNITLGTSALLSGQLWLYNLSNGTNFKFGYGTLVTVGGTMFMIYSNWNTATQVNALRFSFGSGNVSTGTISLFGLIA